jgi:hypothetical protein
MVKVIQVIFSIVVLFIYPDTDFKQDTSDGCFTGTLVITAVL